MSFSEYREFSVGLSLLAGGNGASHAALHNEGRRILGLLDAQKPKRGDDARIQITVSGRPYFADAHADFSVSHSRKAAAVSYLSAPSSGPLRTGCDIQYAPPSLRYENISAHFFDSRERRYIAAAETPAGQSLRFCHIWTLKEAFLKLYGLSVAEIAETPVFSLPDWKPEAQGPRFFLYEMHGKAAERYVLAVAAELPAETPETRPALKEPELFWFSGERMALTRIPLICVKSPCGEGCSNKYMAASSM
ncbi:MAG: 4'-phosphopantetheinyl transferase superfamily protein [Treponema sp.]|jgi:phosphopantetheinyl transferase (holo-ACP synthase)|nr:4'-phosphopantetheinyl transferase superfamily protein [Treponema sp.]